jgi:hypothetical protein
MRFKEETRQVTASPPPHSFYIMKKKINKK